MTRPDYSGWLTDEDVARIVRAFAASQHECRFAEEERQIIKDMASGGKLFKKAIIYIFVALALWALLAKGAAIKAGTMLGWIK
jgi:hypothetical protein